MNKMKFLRPGFPVEFNDRTPQSFSTTESKYKFMEPL